MARLIFGRWLTQTLHLIAASDCPGHCDTQRPADQATTSITSKRDVQAIFFRRRHQPRRPPPAKIRPGSPAPAMGPGTPSRLKSNSASSIWPAAEKCSLSDQKLVCSASAVLRYAYWKLLDEGGGVVSAHHCPHPDTRVLPLPLLGGVHTQAEPVPVPSTPGRTVC